MDNEKNAAEPSGASGGSLAWIPVAERLPEEDVSVLVFTHGWADATLHVASVDDRGEWSPSAGDGYDFPKVTHWMPLPTPPEEPK